MKGTLLGFSLIFIVLFTSCSREIDTKIVSELNNMYYTAAFLDYNFQLINNDSIFLYYNESNKDNIILTNNIIVLSKSSINVNKYIKYGNACKTFKRYIKNYAKIDEGINKSKNQIRALKEDYINNSISDAKFKEYMQTEKRELELVKAAVSKIKSSLVYNVEIYKLLKPDINKLVEQANVKK